MEKKAAAREKEAASREEAIFTTINETNELEKEFAGDEKEFDGDEDDEEMAMARKVSPLIWMMNMHMMTFKLLPDQPHLSHCNLCLIREAGAIGA